MKRKGHIQSIVDAPAFSVLLDHIRWISAFVVLVGHARNKMFVPYSAAPDLGLIAKLFYALTNIQNEAVICFFVISGLLVGGKLLDYSGRPEFPLAKFIIDRLARLYAVLIPALVLSIAVSAVGVCEGAAASSWLGALFYLQDIVVPVSHCNDPLWSLSNEFWYYAIGLFVVLSLRRVVIAMIAMVILVVLLIAVDDVNSHNILLYFPIWAAGMAVFLPWRLRVAPLIPFMVFAASVALSRSHALDGYFWLRDGLMAISLSAFLMAFAARARHGGEGAVPLAGLAKALAGFSFTLYLTHWPILQLFLWLRPDILPLDPKDPVAYLWFILVVGGATAFAYAFSRLTEAETARIRHALYRVAKS